MSRPACAALRASSGSSLYTCAGAPPLPSSGSSPAPPSAAASRRRRPARASRARCPRVSRRETGACPGSERTARHGSHYRPRTHRAGRPATRGLRRCPRGPTPQQRAVARRLRARRRAARTRASSRAGRGGVQRERKRAQPAARQLVQPRGGPVQPRGGGPRPLGSARRRGGSLGPLRPASGMRVTATVPAPCRRRAASARPADRCACRGLRAHGAEPVPCCAWPWRPWAGRAAAGATQPGAQPSDADGLVDSSASSTRVSSAPQRTCRRAPRAQRLGPCSLRFAPRALGGETARPSWALAADSGRRQPAVKP